MKMIMYGRILKIHSGNMIFKCDIGRIFLLCQLIYISLLQIFVSYSLFASFLLSCSMLLSWCKVQSRGILMSEFPLRRILLKLIKCKQSRFCSRCSHSIISHCKHHISLRNILHHTQILYSVSSPSKTFPI